MATVGLQPVFSETQDAMRLYLIRHARPQAGTGRCYGATDLLADPAEQARVLAELTVQLPRGLPMYSSPLQRCASLARALSLSLGSPLPVLDARLAEMDFGEWEMQAWHAIPRTEIDAWAADVVAYQPGGGESVHQVALRVMAFWQDLCRQALPAAIVIAHAGTLRLLQACPQHDCAIPLAYHAAATPHHIAYGSWHVLEMDRAGTSGNAPAPDSDMSE